jgi:UDP-N-acetylmuramoyl-L-alanyl-D-glutamate--2,6-diaminopimelate ligase
LVNLDDILRDVDVKEISGGTNVEISGIACDSRSVGKGFLFVAIRGEKNDGHLFIEEAVNRGARAVICEARDVPTQHATKIVVSGARRALAQAAATFHEHPSKSLGLVGITGTNGKTTTCHLVRNILEEAAQPAGMIGTIEYRIGNESFPAERTTPDPLLLNSLIARMKMNGCRYVVMEVSSHSLDQDRVAGLDFDVAVFTNLTRDHLDYHKTMDNYLRAKTILFESLSPCQKNGFPRRAVICTDQPEGRYILARTKAPVLTYGLNRRAGVTADQIQLRENGCLFTARTPWGDLSVESSLIGRHNVYNILAAIAVGLSQNVEPETILRAVNHTPPIPGRLEFIPNRKGFSIVVDYAHTDDALTNVLTSLKEITKRRLIVVFGCGGDRDRGKREKMGAASSRLADFAVITSDNPRSEDPMEIISEIVRGFGSAEENFIVEPDRRQAIAAAISVAKEGDTVLIAGKGHETYQEFRGYRSDFDDRKVARALVA